MPHWGAWMRMLDIGIHARGSTVSGIVECSRMGDRVDNDRPDGVLHTSDALPDFENVDIASIVRNCVRFDFACHLEISGAGRVSKCGHSLLLSPGGDYEIHCGVINFLHLTYPGDCVPYVVVAEAILIAHLAIDDPITPFLGFVVLMLEFAGHTVSGEQSKR